ncbi:transcriptional repressor [Mycoplasmatota bacterium]|nr:transcriptional repressor [Mycoplasmatota bacterium]
MNLIEIKKKLIKHGINPSISRIKIYESLDKNRIHPTVDKIYNELHGELITLSKTTVYNTLKTFVNHNLVKVVNLGEGELRYDIMQDDHFHFRCKTCDDVYDFNAKEIDIESSNLTGFKIEEVNIYINGQCPKCIKK